MNCVVEEKAPGKTNRLAGSTSTYLKSAAEQPIDWFPWGPEPFELAQRTGRPILLDVGASWCHWCHVMDEGTYADAEVARILGREFIAVKVDRDENPEVDRRYQRQVGALTGEGGWPLTAFLTRPARSSWEGPTFPLPTAMGVRASDGSSPRSPVSGRRSPRRSVRTPTRSRARSTACGPPAPEAASKRVACSPR